MHFFTATHVGFNRVLINPFISEEAWSLEDTLAMLTARFHKKVILDMYVWTDDRDSQRHIIYVRLLFEHKQYKTTNVASVDKADFFVCTFIKVQINGTTKTNNVLDFSLHDFKLL